MPFASRAGDKLDFALTHFGFQPNGLVAADLGSNAGGFVDCLLQRGATRVYAVETGYGVLDWKLRNDDRVVVMERTNAMHVELPEAVDLVTIDVAWTRQDKIIPHAVSLLKPGGRIVSLVKPQYEARKDQRTKGVVHPDSVEDVLLRVEESAFASFTNFQRVLSPVKGEKGGNVEYLYLFTPGIEG